jgi:hypothetical protein
MDSPSPHRTLIVANLTASTPFLLQEVERRAGERPTTFSLLIPNVDTRKVTDWSPDTAVKLLTKAAGGPVEARVGSADDAFESVSSALADGGYDDVLISTLPKRASEWLRRDLPTRVERLGIPVSVVTPPDEMTPLQAFTEQFSSKS